MRHLRELSLCAAAVLGILWSMSQVARSEPPDPKQLTRQIAEQYVKDLIDIPHLDLGIRVPDQMHISIKHSEYQFEHGGAIKIKHRDPTHITYQYSRDNHNLTITQDTIGYHFEKRFNWVK